MDKKIKRKELIEKAKQIDDVKYNISAKSLMILIIFPIILFSIVTELYLIYNNNYASLDEHIWIFNFIVVCILLISFILNNKNRKFLIEKTNVKLRPKVAQAQATKYDYFKFILSFSMSLNMLSVITFILQLISITFIKGLFVVFFNILLAFMSILLINIVLILKERKRLNKI